MIGFVSIAGQVLFTMITAENTVGVVRNTTKAISTDSEQERKEGIKNAVVNICGVIIASAAVYAFSKIKA